MDGVLCESSLRHARAYVEVLAPRGLRFPVEEILLREGGKSATIIRALSEKYGVPIPQADVAPLAQAKQEAFRAMGKPPLYPAVPRMLEAVRERGYKTGIATGTTRRNLEFMLGDLLQGIDAPVTMEDCPQEKPDPGPYLEAARRLGVLPRACTVVENAPNGIRAGKRAGMRVIALSTTLPEGLLGEADVVCASHEEALFWL